jgi:hypothetical protein
MEDKKNYPYYIIIKTNIIKAYILVDDIKLTGSSEEL